MLRYGATLPISSLDAVRSSANEATSLLYSRLFTVDAYGELVPDLAQDYQVSDDGLQYTFTPRSGALWSDGVEVSAADLTLSLRLVSDPELRDAAAVRFPQITEVRTEGGDHAGRTVLRLDAPQPSLIHALNKVRIVAAHRHSAREYADGASDRDPVGSGPYRLLERDDQGCTFEARSDYHGQVAGLAIVRMHQIADDRDRALALAEGRIDFGQIKAQDADLLKGAEGVSAHRIRTRVWRSLTFRLSHPYLSDPLLRRALSLLIDREEVVARALGGAGLPQYWPVPPGSWASPDHGPAGGPDVAETAMVEAGWERTDTGAWRKAGHLLSLHFAYLETETFRRVASEVIAEQFEAFGIPVRLSPITWEAYRDMDANGLRGTVYDGIVVGWSGGIDPYENLASRLRSDGVYNRDGYADAEVDDLLDQAVRAVDRAEATVLYRRVLEIAQRDSIMAPLANPLYLFGARDHLTGFEDFEVDSFYELPQYTNLIRSTR